MFIRVVIRGRRRGRGGREEGGIHDEELCVELMYGCTQLVEFLNQDTIYGTLYAIEDTMCGGMWYFIVSTM